MAFTAFLLVRARRQLGSWRSAVLRYRAAVAASLAGLFGFLWWLGISLETQAGFAGNPRYAVLGVMLVCISGAPRTAGRASAWRDSAAGAAAPARAGTAAWTPADHDRHRADAWWSSCSFPAGSRTACRAWLDPLRAALPGATARAVLRPDPARGRRQARGQVRQHDDQQLQVTMVAWYLDVPIYWRPGAATEAADQAPGRTWCSRMAPTAPRPRPRVRRHTDAGVGAGLEAEERLAATRSSRPIR